MFLPLHDRGDEGRGGGRDANGLCTHNEEGTAPITYRELGQLSGFFRHTDRLDDGLRRIKLTSILALVVSKPL